ncbi:hypothetical protein EVAR_82417_1 [Eumeta japonica]|uniref:Uncharacterized protein n=1 Tax=Eumeta variegata TaxID=151549 RepID=A0A4C1YK51_EUMVA|nr:hypothetical protein EVAR_82417_1 [Eumeta japonica]
MDVDHEKLLSGDVNFKWQRDFTAFTAVREEFLVHPVGAVKDYDSPYDAFIIFDVDIMKEIVIETNRYAHQVIDKAKAVVYIQCHRAYNDKQPLPNAKSKQPLAASNQPVTDCEEKNNNEESVDDCDERAEAGRAGSKVGTNA